MPKSYCVLKFKTLLLNWEYDTKLNLFYGVTTIIHLIMISFIE